MSEARTGAGARYLAKQLVGSSALGFELLQRLPGAGSRSPVHPGSVACIDGFPRSANSFAVRAFRTWNPAAEVGHHSHLAGQVLRSLDLGIPTAVLIREPEDAVCSLVVHRGGELAPGLVLRAYARFYERLAPRRGELVCCRFEEVIADPVVLVRRLNERFGTVFAVGRLSAGERERIFGELEAEAARGRLDPARRIASYGSPEERKRAVREAVASHRLLERARSAHRAWTDPGA